MIGTERYMAPEQLADGKITPAADVYACGVVADELLPQSRAPELREIVERCLRAGPGRALHRRAIPRRGARDGGRRRRGRSGPPDPLAGPADAAPPAYRPGHERAGRPRLTSRAGAGRSPPGSPRAVAIAGHRRRWHPPRDRLRRIRGSPTKADGAKQRATPVSVPTSSDPAEQARELADFFRAQSRWRLRASSSGPALSASERASSSSPAAWWWPAVWSSVGAVVGG